MDRRLLVSIVLLLVLPGRAESQISFVNDLFKSVHDVNTSAGFSSIHGSGPLAHHGLTSVSFEVTLEVAGQSKPANGDTTGTSETPRVERNASEHLDSPWDVEVGLSYERVSGFNLADTTFTLIGAVDEAPVISVYFNYDGDSTLGWYLGARAGIAKLADVQAIADSARTWSASGTTVMYGLVLGGYWKFRNTLYPYAEASTTVRRFPALAWAPPSGTAFVPDALPRRLSMNTWDLSFGVQVNLK